MARSAFDVSQNENSRELVAAILAYRRLFLHSLLERAFLFGDGGWRWYAEPKRMGDESLRLPPSKSHLAPEASSRQRALAVHSGPFGVLGLRPRSRWRFTQERAFPSQAGLMPFAGPIEEDIPAGVLPYTFADYLVDWTGRAV